VISWIFTRVIEINLLGFSLLVVEKTTDFLHINYPINLTGCKLTQPVLTAWTNLLLVHSHLLPIFKKIFMLSLVLERWLLHQKSTRIDGYSINWNLPVQQSLLVLCHYY